MPLEEIINRQGIIISAPASGAGKTTVTLGLINAFARKRSVQPFKSGPDYIDSKFQSVAADCPSYNLDTWAMSSSDILNMIGMVGPSDLCIAEGSMGLFDGVISKGAGGNGSTADLASITNWPVILVVDCAKQAQSVAALITGFNSFRHDITIGGIILNNISSKRHEALVVSEVSKTKVPILGVIPRSNELTIPERHLGLVQAEDLSDLEQLIFKLGTLIEENCDLEAIACTARNSFPPISTLQKITPPAQRIAIAKDNAFTFTYSHLIEGWKKQGAEISFFSPLNDEPPSKSDDMVWLPGGYPELYLGRLSECKNFKNGLIDFSKKRPVHGECGGYMVLGRKIIGKSGQAYDMIGMFDLVTSFEKRKLNLGYRKAKAIEPFFGIKKGSTVLGHEFHYTTVVEINDAPIVFVKDAYQNELGQLGSKNSNATGTFFHLIGSEQ